MQLSFSFKQRRTKMYVCEDCGHSTDDPEDFYSHLTDNHPNSLALQRRHDKRLFKFSSSASSSSTTDFSSSSSNGTSTSGMSISGTSTSGTSTSSSSDLLKGNSSASCQETSSTAAKSTDETSLNVVTSASADSSIHLGQSQQLLSDSDYRNSRL